MDENEMLEKLDVRSSQHRKNQSVTGRKTGGPNIQPNAAKVIHEILVQQTKLRKDSDKKQKSQNTSLFNNQSREQTIGNESGSREHPLGEEGLESSE
jgi:hypothetical protein